MKINVIKKNVLHIGTHSKESRSGNLYAVMVIADKEGNIHKVYVKEPQIEKLMTLNERDFISEIILEVVYNGKNNGVSLVDIVL